MEHIQINIHVGPIKCQSFLSSLFCLQGSERTIGTYKDNAISDKRGAGQLAVKDSD